MRNCTVWPIIFFRMFSLLLKELTFTFYLDTPVTIRNGRIQHKHIAVIRMLLVGMYTLASVYCECLLHGPSRFN